MIREAHKQKILKFLLSKNVNKFWANSVLKHIIDYGMFNFPGNTYWLTNIKALKVSVGYYGTVDKFIMLCAINTETTKINSRLVCTFNKGYSVAIVPLAEKTHSYYNK